MKLDDRSARAFLAQPHVAAMLDSFGPVPEGYFVPAATEEQLDARAGAPVDAAPRRLADIDAEERLGPVASGGPSALCRQAGRDLVDGFAEGVVAEPRMR